MGARPLNLFDEPYMNQFIIEVSNQVYKPPHRYLIGGELLDQCYSEVVRKVESVLATQEQLNFVLDESPNLNSQQIVNLSVVIPNYGSFYLNNHHVGDKDLGAAFFVDWFIRCTMLYCTDFKQISSLTTDTCSTIRKT